MDGSSRIYGNAFAGSYSRNPDATGGDRFKTNVNRSKTRKWVEAKVQSYNGDDWGADYDEELEAESYPEPQPTARPLGSRQPDQPLTATAYPTGAHTTCQPSVDSLSHLVSHGPPPLHVHTQQTQQLLSSSDPSGGDQATAPSQGPGSRQATNASLLPIRGPHSAVRPSDVCSSDQGYGGGPMSANFPLRKSSLESAEPPRHPTSSQPVSADKAWPWPESKSPGKAMTFIRPADIYKRMSEEVDRERRSLDSGPNSIDCQSRVVERGPEVLARSEGGQEDPQQTSQTQQTPGPAADITQPSRTARPSLPSLAERKSEYGLDGLLASYGDEDAAELGERPLPTKPNTRQQVSQQGNTTSQRQSVSSDTSVSPRFSTSPQLPDVSRTSGFGDDFFSGPSGFTIDPSPPTSTRETPSPSPSSPKKDPAGESAKESEIRAKMSVLPPPSLEPGAARESAEARPRTPVVTPLVPDTLKGSPEGAPKPSSPSASGKVHSLVQAINSRSASPERLFHASPSTPLQETNDLQATVDPNAAPTTGIPGAAGDGLEKQSHREAYRTITAQSRHTNDDPEEEGISVGTKNKLGKDALSKDVTTLLTPKPSDEAQPLAPSKIGGSLPLAVSVPPASQAGQETSSCDSSSSSAQSEITPTAPLNTRKGAATPDIKDEPVAPSLVARQPTIDTATSSPAKESESDVLREEIIKSLSPVHVSPEVPGARPRKRSVGSSSAESPVRESSYLPDLYDDYWSSGEVKAAQGAHEECARIPEDPGIPNVAGEQRPVEYSEEAAPRASQPAELAAPAFEVPHLQNIDREPEKTQVRPRSASGSRHALRRFSWQQGSEQVNTSGHDDDEVIESPSPGINRPDSDIFGSTPVVLAADTLSGASTSRNGLPATTEGDAGTKSPPLSDTTVPEANGLPRSQEAGVPSLVPPSAETQTRTPSPPTVQRTTTRTTMYETPVLTFREIMNLSTSEDRRRAFNEARAHFGSSDVGLTGWMVAMRIQHVEYANMSSSFASAAASSPTAGPGGDHSGAHGLGYSTHGGGPHLPQYLISPTYLHGVSFQHTSQQVGTKSKELLMAAGKAGKGLLSKGKNKLRVTGDRVFS